MENTDNKISRRSFLDKLVGSAFVVTVCGIYVGLPIAFTEVGKHLSLKEAKESARFRTHPVDQVFRDWNGFRTYFTGEKGLVRENRYLNHNYEGVDEYLENAFKGISEENKNRFNLLGEANRNGESVRIIKDLDTGTRGFVNALMYDNPRLTRANYVEMHLPKDGKLSSGIGITGRKNPIYPNMGEIK